MESFRKTDMHAEKALADFMDASLYSKMHDANGLIKYERILDYSTQLNGVDVIIESTGKKFYIDEKASLYYSNAMIPTFAFEIDSMQKNHKEAIQGWFVNNDLKTDYYMLIWPNIKCNKPVNSNNWERVSLANLTSRDFTIVEAMLIKKDKIHAYLENCNWAKDRLLAYAKKLRTVQNQIGKINVEETDSFYFYYTKSLAEEPINIVIKKSVLRELADSCYFISAESYAVVK